MLTLHWMHYLRRVLTFVIVIAIGLFSGSVALRLDLCEYKATDGHLKFKVKSSVAVNFLNTVIHVEDQKTTDCSSGFLSDVMMNKNKTK